MCGCNVWPSIGAQHSSVLLLPRRSIYVFGRYYQNSRKVWVGIEVSLLQLFHHPANDGISFVAESELEQRLSSLDQAEVLQVSKAVDNCLGELAQPTARECS
jgi:hypothetical protein